ncbi:MAG: class II aldolase/adducin family protein [Prevotella sp.]|nr:class II aldolase/adducin family protein [Prevotella sp.]
MNIRIMHPADQICMVMKRIYDRNLTTLTGGNISVMDSKGVMWITPASIDKGSLQAGDIVRVFRDGKTEGKYRPSSEYRIHHRILLERPDIKAVIHAHSPEQVTMSILHKIPENRLYPAVYEAVPKIELAEYAMPGTTGLVDCVGNVFAKGYNAAILKNHAAFLGSTAGIFDAINRFEELDFAERLFVYAHTLGVPEPATEKQLIDYQRKVSVDLPQFIPHCISPEEYLLRDELAVLSRRAYQRSLFTGFNGVISARVDDDSFIIARAGCDNAYITADDFVRIEKGKCEAGIRPADSVELHFQIYHKHPDINSIIIAAPAYSMSFAVTGQEYPVHMMPESYGVLKKCIQFPFDALFEPEQITDDLSLKTPFALVKNYGLILAGPNPILAFDKLEVCEFTAQSIHQTRIMGGQIHYLTQEMIEELDSQ